MTARTVLRVLICGTAVLLPVVAVAQTAGERRLEVSGGVGWFGATAFRPVDATETTPSGGRRIVFSTSSALEASPGVAVRVGTRLTSQLLVESAVGLNPSRLATRISGDVEQGPGTTASEDVTQYLVEGGLVLHLRRWQTGRLAPFAAAGAGYLRQLHEGQTLVQTGRSYYVGGGTHYLLKQGGAGLIGSAGVRLDVRATVLENGLALDGARHVVPVVAAALFFRF